MKLMTKEIEKAIPKLYETEDDNEAKAQIKFFTPWSDWTWYGFEYDPDTRTFFGLVDGFEKEWGYFSLDELQEVSGPMGLKIERDMHYTPESKQDLMNKLGMEC